MADDNVHDEPVEQTDKGDKKNDPAAKRKKTKIFIILGIVLLTAAILGILSWLHSRQFEKTDDAFIEGHVSQVAPQVAGRVIKLLVTDNQEVEQGQTLFELDPRDQEAAVRQRQAQKLEAEASVKTAQTNLDKSRRDLDRYNATDVRAVAQQQVDDAIAQVASDEAALESANATVERASADLAAAELQLSYMTVRAPQKGRVTRRTVELGNYLEAGAPSLAIVSDDLWVVANFKETQLAHMKIGQKVEIEVDAYPDAVISGHIESFQSGTGSVFSSLPAENATGNYVKIVQRVPVKILIDKIEKDEDRTLRLAPGLSVLPKVTVR